MDGTGSRRRKDGVVVERLTPLCGAKYDRRTGVIQPAEVLEGDDLADNIKALGSDYEVVESGLLGWEPYNTLIRYDDLTEDGGYYLAQLEAAGG
jgi:hypothetical protein